MGLIAHTRVEATVRFAAEFGYDSIVVKDATADYSDTEMHAALAVNLPSYASAIVIANEVVEAISALNSAVGIVPVSHVAWSHKLRSLPPPSA